MHPPLDDPTLYALQGVRSAQLMRLSKTAGPEVRAHLVRGVSMQTREDFSVFCNLASYTYRGSSLYPSSTKVRALTHGQYRA
jgi:hypothetical protein